MIHKTPNVGRTTNCSHRHCIIDHHLSMGLSIAVYRLLCPPLKEEATDEIKNARMTMVMDEGIFRICHFAITQRSLPTGKCNCQRMDFVNPAIRMLYQLPDRKSFIERTAIFCDTAHTNVLNPDCFCSCRWNAQVWTSKFWGKKFHLVKGLFFSDVLFSANIYQVIYEALQGFMWKKNFFFCSNWLFT